MQVGIKFPRYAAIGSKLTCKSWFLQVSEIPTARQNVRRPKLKSVSEIEDVFGDENVGKKIIVPRGNRRRLSTQGSVSELDNVPSKSKDVQEQKTPTKITKAYNFLRPIQPFSVSEDGTQVKNIPSPIPLPKGRVSSSGILGLT